MRRCPPGSTPFPYTTLFRSSGDRDDGARGGSARDRARNDRPRAIVAEAGLSHRRWRDDGHGQGIGRSEEHTSELQSLRHLVCRLLREKKNKLWLKRIRFTSG